MVFFFENDNTGGSTRRVFRSWDYSGNTFGPQLILEWDEPIGGSFSITDVTVSPTSVIRSDSNNVVLRVDWTDPADLTIDSYTAKFWIRDPDDKTLGPYTAEVYEKEGSEEYNAIIQFRLFFRRD